MDESETWVATVPALPGCISQGCTNAEAEANILDAIELALDDDEPLTERELVAIRDVEVGTYSDLDELLRELEAASPCAGGRSWKQAFMDIDLCQTLAHGWAEPWSEPPSPRAAEVAKMAVEQPKAAGILIDRISPELEVGLVVHLAPRCWEEGELPAILGGFYISNDGSTCSYLTNFSNLPGEFFDCEPTNEGLRLEVARIAAFFELWLRPR